MNIYKVLGQVNPNATTLTTLYTTPSNTQSVISTLVVCNQGVTGLFRIAIRPNNNSISPEQYIIYDSSIDANNSAFFTIGITLNQNDVVSVYSSTNTMSFSLFGQEIS